MCAAGSGGERERIGRRFQHDHVPDASGKQRHAAELLGLTEDRPGVPAEPHAGVDEPGQILGRVVPERRADDAVFGRDLGEHDPRGARIRRPPGALDDADNLDVVAVVAAGEHRGDGDAPGARAAPRGRSSAPSRASTFGAKPAADGASFNLDEIARLQIGPGADGAGVGGNQHPLPELTVVDDQAVAGQLVEVGDRRANQDAIAERAAVLREGADLRDAREERKRARECCPERGHGRNRPVRGPLRFAPPGDSTRRPHTTARHPIRSSTGVGRPILTGRRYRVENMLKERAFLVYRWTNRIISGRIATKTAAVHHVDASSIVLSLDCRHGATTLLAHCDPRHRM